MTTIDNNLHTKWHKQTLFVFLPCNFLEPKFQNLNENRISLAKFQFQRVQRYNQSSILQLLLDHSSSSSSSLISPWATSWFSHYNLQHRIAMHSQENIPQKREMNAANNIQFQFHNLWSLIL